MIGSVAGLIIREVEPGTVIHREPGDEGLVVTDEAAVQLGGTLYVTASILAAIRRMAAPATPAREVNP